MRHTENSLLRLLIFLTVFLLLSLIISAYAALLPPLFSSEEQGTWFQRSGALVVIISVWIQFKLQDVYTYFDRDAYCVPFTMSSFTERYYSAINSLNLLFAIAGTVIWGYGDLLIQLKI